MENIQKHAIGTVAGWLYGEQAYQFDKSDGIFTDYPQRLRYLMEQEVPQRWQRMRLFADQDMPYHPTQQLFKAVGAARAAVVLQAQSVGWSRAEALDISWNCLSAVDSCDDLRPYDELLGAASLKEVIHDPEYTYADRHQVMRPALVKLAGIAAAHVVRLEEIDGAAVIPVPGYPSGEIVLPD